MAIPTQPDRSARDSGQYPDPAWTELDAEAKRERLLSAAGEVFARDSIEAPMPAVAAAAGAGIGSVYRQFPSKEDLMAALVVRRLDTVTADIEAALARGGEPWPAFVALMWELADRQAGDDVVAEAMATVTEDPAVAERAWRCEQRIEALMEKARSDGSLRPDATPSDVRLLLAAVRAVRRREPESWRRMLELGLAGLGG